MRDDLLDLDREIATFLAETWGGSSSTASLLELRREALARGYFARTTPKSFGGAGLSADPFAEQVWRDACRRADVPLRPEGMGVQLVAPTLLEAGSEDQKHRFVRAALTGEHVWCQGFSEPGAGSDLAALRTRADPDGDGYRINGHKIWTTHVDRAGWILLLCRTDTTAARHGGLSFFLLDLNTPGVTVRPIRQITGETEFGEVFLDEVHLPASERLGREGDGWRIANLALRHERGWIGEDLRGEFDRLVSLARSTELDGRAALACDDVRLELAQIEGALVAHEAAAAERLRRMGDEAEPALIDYSAKLYATELMSRLTGFGVDLLGERAGLAPHTSDASESEPEARYWMRQDFWSLAYAIAGGSSFIQKDVIAARGLRLPRAGGA